MTRADIRRSIRALDEDVLRELQRGATFAVTLPNGLWPLLTLIVAEDGVGEAAVEASRNRRLPFRRVLSRRRIDALLSRRYVRREQDRLLPTVRGVGAVRPLVFVRADGAYLNWLRGLRLAEIAAFPAADGGNGNPAAPV
ncbi:MAG: hypothetical protein WA971_12935 [Microbacterium sp.]